jgi:hypothetical protein
MPSGPRWDGAGRHGARAWASGRTVRRAPTDAGFGGRALARSYDRAVVRSHEGSVPPAPVGRFETDDERRAREWYDRRPGFLIALDWRAANSARLRPVFCRRPIVATVTLVRYPLPGTCVEPIDRLGANAARLTYRQPRLHGPLRSHRASRRQDKRHSARALRRAAHAASAVAACELEDLAATRSTHPAYSHAPATLWLFVRPHLRAAWTVV